MWCWSWAAAALSKILLRKGRLEIGWQLLGSSGSRPGFLIVGITAANLKLEGTMPEREALMMVTTAGQRVGRQAFTRVVGNGSKLLDVVLDLVMRSRTWSGSSREKVEKQQADGWCLSCRFNVVGRQGADI